MALFKNKKENLKALTGLVSIPYDIFTYIPKF